MIRRLPMLLAQVKTGNKSKKSKNEIRNNLHIQQTNKKCTV